MQYTYVMVGDWLVKVNDLHTGEGLVFNRESVSVTGTGTPIPRASSRVFPSHVWSSGFQNLTRTPSEIGEIKKKSRIWAGITW